MSEITRQNQAIVKQKNDKFTVKFNLPAGEMTTHQLRHIAKVSEKYGDGIMQINFRQSFEIRDVAEENIPKLTYDMAYIGITVENSEKYQNIVACPGADQCGLAVVKTIDLARALNYHLANKLDKAETKASMAINVSGCGNGCTHPLINDIGLIGSVGRVDGKKVLGWNVHIGGKLGEDQVIALPIGFIEQGKVIQAVDIITDTYLADNKPDITLQSWLLEHTSVHKVTDNLKQANILYPTLNETE